MQVGFWWRRVSDPGRGGFILVDVKRDEMPIRKFYVQLIQEEPCVHLDDIKIDRTVFGNTACPEDRRALLLAVLSKLDRSGEQTMKSKMRQSGFSLLELVVAMAIGLIITAAGVFAYSTATRAAHQNSALESTLTLAKSVPTYVNEFGTAAATANLASTYTALGDSSNCPAAGPSATVSCIAPIGVINADTGYDYAIAYVSPSAWAVTGTPKSGTANTKSYCVDQSGTPTFTTTASPASAAAVTTSSPATCLQNGYTALGS